MSDRHNYDHADDTALAELSELYQQAPAAEPSLELNERILATARAETRVRRLPGRRLRRWSLPLSLAAVLVLAVSLVPLLHQRLPDTRDAAGPETAASPAAEFATDAAPAPRQRSAATEEITADTLRAVPAPSSAEPGDDRAPAAGVAIQESVTEAPVPSAPTRADGLAAPASTPTLSGSASAEAPPAAMSETPARTAVFSDPERWLTWIRLLYRQGRETEAEAELRAFRRQFPDYPLDSLDLPGEP